MAENPFISIIIVTYNSAAHLRPTIEAALAQDYAPYETILVDNASGDDSLAIAREYEARGLKVIANPVNRGFAGGNNDGARASRGEIVFLVNPDAILQPDGLREIAAAFAETPDLGVLGAKLIAPDGETILHCGGTVGLPAHCSLYGRGEKDRGQWETPAEVEYVVGAAMALRREVWDALGGFDEFFNPAYYEDTDLCIRARRLGKKVIYWPRLRLIHHENVSTDYKSREFWRMHHRSRLWFTFKNTPLMKLLLVAIPAEMGWYFSHNSVGVRKMMLKLYAKIALRTVRYRLKMR